MYFTKSKHCRLQLAERNAKDEEDVFSKVYFPRPHLRSIFRLVHAPTEFAARANQKGLTSCAVFTGHISPTRTLAGSFGGGRCNNGHSPVFVPIYTYYSPVYVSV